ncbi:MAG: RRXRR domain-containing protein [Burkholderiales bacterium]|nr:RRXRR domain-containing protein [Anaerolineae bacterium]
MQYVPVLSSTGQRLMPCHAARVRQLVREGKAVRCFDRGLFYIKLTERVSGDIQPIAVGIDPGSKKEALTVKSASRTYLNIQADAVTWVKDAEETSTNMRRTRRGRNTPYRKMRVNRRQGQFKLPPSTRARWGWKLRLCNWLARYYPIETFVVEDVAAVTKAGKRRWNQSFSPLEVGKLWFYLELEKLAQVKTLKGYETKAERDALGLKKSKQKMSDKFEAHCVDSWVLANWWVGGHTQVDNKSMLYIVPLRFHRRQLHLLQPAKGSIRKPYGSTNSLGFRRGSWVKHPKHGVCYVGGTTAGTISLHSLQTGQRVTKIKPNTVQFLNRSSWRMRKEASHSSPA